MATSARQPVGSRYTLTMSTRVTLTVPDQVFQRLREQSKAQGQSIDETALGALCIGLGEPNAPPWWGDLGALLARAPTRRFEPERFSGAEDDARSDDDILLDLDWVRGGSE
jgi:hypothetical protein